MFDVTGGEDRPKDSAAHARDTTAIGRRCGFTGTLLVGVGRARGPTAVAGSLTLCCNPRGVMATGAKELRVAPIGTAV